MHFDPVNSAFPVSTGSEDAQGTVFKHTLAGGMTFREYIAIELLKGMLSNPSFTTGTVEQLEKLAENSANRFELRLRPDSTPIVNS